jgi:hypothetical protein
MTLAELERALREELRGFPPDKADEFLNTALVLMMAPTGEAALLRQREKLDAVECVEQSAKACLDSTAAMPPLDDGLLARDAVKLADAVHQAGGLRRLVGDWSLKHEGEPTEQDKAEQFLWLRFQEARIKINAAIEDGGGPEEFDTAQQSERFLGPPGFQCSGYVLSGASLGPQRNRRVHWLARPSRAQISRLC